MTSIPRWLKITIPPLIVLLIIGFFAFGWFASSKILGVNNQKINYDQTVEAVSGDSYTFKGSVYDIDGIFGGYRSDGSFIGIFEQPAGIDDSREASTRILRQLEGTAPKVGDSISLQGNIWITDPKLALGIDFEGIKYAGPLGAMDAWIVRSPDSTTWTIGVHGIGAPKAEMLRFMRPVINSGSNMMVINYRNDENNPRSPDGLSHLGGSEWADLEAAVNYARANGAEKINLYGISMGGSVVQNYLRKSFDVTESNINKVVLDSPALDWKEILTYRIKKDGYPGFGFYPAATVMKFRGVSVADISTKPEDIKHKTLIIHNIDDTTVPQAASKRLAVSRSDLVTFVDFGAGEHTRAWNHDPAKYDQLVADFLRQ